MNTLVQTCKHFTLGTVLGGMLVLFSANTPLPNGQKKQAKPSIVKHGDTTYEVNVIPGTNGLSEVVVKAKNEGSTNSRIACDVSITSTRPSNPRSRVASLPRFLHNERLIVQMKTGESYTWRKQVATKPGESVAASLTSSDGKLALRTTGGFSLLLPNTQLRQIRAQLQTTQAK